MEHGGTFSAEGVRRLHDVMRWVNSPGDLSEVLEEVARGVVEGLGYGVAAIARLEGDTFVMTAVAGPENVREEILGRRTPVRAIFDEFLQADHWGVLRYVPHERFVGEAADNAWVPDFTPDESDPEAWHPMDALYAPLYSADGQLLGNMSVDLPPGGKVPTRQQRELLEMYVVQAGLAIAHAQQRELLAEQVRLGQALKVVAAAGSRGDLEAVLAEAAPALHAGLNATQVTLRCFHEAGGRTEHAAGYPTEARSGDHAVDLRLDLVAFVSEHGPRPLLLERDGGDWDCMPRTEDFLRGILDERGWERLLVTPLGVGRDVLGYLVVMRGPDLPPFAPGEVDAVHEAGRVLGRQVHVARVRERERLLLAELQQLDRYKGELIATISHELKTPLTSIIGHTELLEDAGVDGASVQAIKRNADRLDRLITELLTFSRVQDRSEVSRSPIDLVEACRASLELLAVQARTGGVDLRLTEPAGPVVVQGEPEELTRVIDNICSNAVKYTRPGGRVEVAVREAGGFGEVVVSDTGIGISAGDLAHLFSAFHRSTNPDALTIPGTGLGLAIARRIAELHGGDIAVESELGRGSTFTVRVPVTAP